MPNIRLMRHDEHNGFGNAKPVNRRMFAVATYRTKSRKPGWWIEVETTHAFDVQRLAQKYLIVMPEDCVAIVVPDGWPDNSKIGQIKEKA